MRSVKIGFIPTRRDVFSKEDAKRHKDIILEKLKSFSNIEVVDIEDINKEGLLFDEKDIPSICAKMKKACVEGVFFPHCNFGTENLVAKTAKEIGKPILIWGPRDDAPLHDGERTRDTQCGMFATGKVLRRFNLPFTYIVNSRVDDDVFIKGYKDFAATCSVVTAFKKIRILQIAPRPAAFWTMICNEGELLEKFGIEIFPVTLQDIKTKTDYILENKKYIKNYELINSKINCSNIPRESVEKLAALKTVINEYCENQNCSAVAIQCWDALQDTLEIMPCIANGLLCDEYIPTVCETDLHGAVSAIMLQEAAMRTTPVFFADLTVRHPSNDNAELLWHCGNFPPSIAKEGSVLGAGCHFIKPSHLPGTGEWELKHGDVTICRFDGDHGEYKLFLGEGKGIDGPKTKGTYLWVQVDNWEKWEHKLVTGPYVHHCAGIHAKVSNILHEACKYIDGLIPDPANN